MSELSNLTRKRLEKYTVGLQNMNAEQRELLACKDKELDELRQQNKTLRAAQKACVDCEGMSDEEFLECKKDRELLDFADELHNEWSFYDHNGYRRSYEGTLRQALRQAIRHSQTDGEGEG